MSYKFKSATLHDDAFERLFNASPIAKFVKGQLDKGHGDSLRSHNFVSPPPPTRLVAPRQRPADQRKTVASTHGDLSRGTITSPTGDLSRLTTCSDPSIYSVSDKSVGLLSTSAPETSNMLSSLPRSPLRPHNTKTITSKGARKNDGGKMTGKSHGMKVQDQFLSPPAKNIHTSAISMDSSYTGKTYLSPSDYERLDLSHSPGPPSPRKQLTPEFMNAINQPDVDSPSPVHLKRDTEVTKQVPKPSFNMNMLQKFNQMKYGKSSSSNAADSELKHGEPSSPKVDNSVVTSLPQLQSSYNSSEHFDDEGSSEEEESIGKKEKKRPQSIDTDEDADNREYESVKNDLKSKQTKNQSKT